jgi:hypothetical protein
LVGSGRCCRFSGREFFAGSRHKNQWPVVSGQWSVKPSFVTRNAISFPVKSLGGLKPKFLLYSQRHGLKPGPDTNHTARHKVSGQG